MSTNNHIYATAITDNETKVTRPVSAIVTGLIFDPNYIAGDEVLPQTLVYSNGWQMISNKQTSEVAHPQYSGEPFNVYDGTLSSAQSTVKQIIFGTRYTFPRGGYVIGYRVDVIAGNYYEVFSANLASGEVQHIESFTANTTGWRDSPLTSREVLTGEAYDIFVKVNESDPTPTVVPLSYNYTKPNNETVPLSGQIVHSNKRLDELWISSSDQAGDQYAFLASLTVGDIITQDGTSWSIQNIVDETTYFKFTVAPTTQLSTTGIKTFNFETVTPTPITYGQDIDYWLSNPNVQGLFIIDDEYPNVTPDNTARGVDLTVQEATIPVDWDFLGKSSL